MWQWFKDLFKYYIDQSFDIEQSAICQEGWSGNKLAILDYHAEKLSPPLVKIVNGEYHLINNEILQSRLERTGGTLLHWAIIRQRTELVAALLEQGASLFVKDNYRMSPLHWARWQQLEDNGNDYIESFQKGQKIKPVYQLVLKAADLTKDNIPTLLWLAASKNPDIPIFDNSNLKIHAIQELEDDSKMLGLSSW